LRGDYRHLVKKDHAEEEIETAWVQHFLDVMSDDWSGYFVETAGPSDYYVYIHFDPRVDRRISLNCDACSVELSGEPFYVGKGRGLRAYNLRRNDGHAVILRELRNDGLMAEDLVKIVARDLTEAKALEIESKLIFLFGSRYSAIDAGPLVNLATTAGPAVKRQRPEALRNNTKLLDKKKLW
jgi:hypothetical protein